MGDDADRLGRSGLHCLSSAEEGRCTRCRLTVRNTIQTTKARQQCRVFSFAWMLQCIGRDWHLADIPTAPANVRYWSNNGQRWVLACDGLSAYDPCRTSATISCCSSKVSVNPIK